MKPLGRPRHAGKVIAAGLGTLGIAFAWYYFQAFREVDLQGGRRHSATFFLIFIPVIGPFFGIWYTIVELRSLDASRGQVGLPPGLGPGRHAALVLAGCVLAQVIAIPALLATWGILGTDAWLVEAGVTAWIAPTAAVPALSRSINEYWARLGASAPAVALK